MTEERRSQVRKVDYLIQALRVRRGSEAEQRFFEAFAEESFSHPDWFRGIEQSKDWEEPLGIDAHALTDAGKIPIQLKSSISGKHHHHRNHPDRADIVVIVIELGFTAAQIRSKTYAALSRARYELTQRNAESMVLDGETLGDTVRQQVDTFIQELPAEVCTNELLIEALTRYVTRKIRMRK